MDKIYSRRKVSFPKVKGTNINKKKVRKIYFTFLILIISITTGYKVLKSIDPIFESLCITKAQSIATDITNRKSSEVLARYNYQDTVEITKDEQGNNSILRTDIVTLNEIISDITLEIQNELNEIGLHEIEIPVGTLIGNQYFAGMGPDIKIQIISTGDIITDIKTEFESAGINQTVYRIYLDIECNVSILTTYRTIDRKINNQVLLVETVIMGGVPETYLQLDKMEE